MSPRRLVLVACGMLLLAATVVVFQHFDRTSHSASDTLRPFLIAMVPVWTVAIAVGAVLLRGRR